MFSRGVACPCPGAIYMYVTIIFKLLLKFSSETTWPIKAKLYVEDHLEGAMKVCINGQGHMTKMAAMAINSKNL